MPRYNFLAIIYYKKLLAYLNHHVGNVKVNTDTWNAGFFYYLVKRNEFMMKDIRRIAKDFCKKSIILISITHTKKKPY